MPTSADMICFRADELKTKEFNNFIDKLLTSGEVDDEIWHKRSKVQNEVYNVINRSLKRLSK